MDSSASFNLDSFFNPKSVAIVGATEKPGSIGRALTRNVKLDSRGTRTIYPINPTSQTILEIKAYPKLEALPTVPELVVIVTPAKTVPGIVQSCVTLKVPAVIIISAGFKEVGGPGVELENEILRLIRQPGSITRIIGPNCIGCQSPALNFNATFTTQMGLPGKIGLISQSGAMVTCLLDWTFQYNVGFAQLASVGSMMDLNWADLILHMGNCDLVSAILIYMETVGDARSFLAAARQVAPRKPIVVLKPGRTQAAAAAAVSHTGSLTGSDEMLDAAFKRAGIIRVDRIEELFVFASIFNTQSLPKGPRIAMVTNAGGPGVMATDATIRYGSQLAPLKPDTLARLNEFLPPHWSHANPIDMIGSATAETYNQTLDVLMTDDDIDSVLILAAPVSVLNPFTLAQVIKSVGVGARKPVMACLMGGEELGGARSMLARAGIPTFAFSDDACRMFGYMNQHVANLRDLYQVPRAAGVPDEEAQTVVSRVKDLIAEARAAHRDVLTESESKRLLSVYGIPVAETVVCATIPEAVTAATRMGYPVVLKLNSETITHKSDVGGVMLNIDSDAAVRSAYEQIKANVTAKKGAQHFQGVAVQPMISANSYELLLGATSDAQLGPVIVFGSGGKMVEVMKDTALALPPLNAHYAKSLIDATKISKCLKGFRGQPPVNEERLGDILVRFSRLLCEHREIREVDINPLMASGDRIIAVDARVVLYPKDTPADKIPVVAIRPYPVEHISRISLADGTPCIIRPIRADDIPALCEFHRLMTPQSAAKYYGRDVPIEERMAPNHLRDVCFADYDDNFTSVCEMLMSGGAHKVIAGVARAQRLGTDKKAMQVFLGVREGLADNGISQALITHLRALAPKEGIERMLTRPDDKGVAAPMTVTVIPAQ